MLLLLNVFLHLRWIGGVRRHQGDDEGGAVQEIETIASVPHIELQRRIPLRAQCGFVGERSMTGVAVLARDPCVWGPSARIFVRIGGWKCKIASFNDHDRKALDFLVCAYVSMAILVVLASV